MSLQKIQSKLNAPKDLFNSFGKYKYRSCEGILKAVKPLLAEFEYELLLSDKMIEVGGRVYVQATATVKKKGVVVHETNACAREAENKKGMDDAQITGACSSYARKYALNGLFCIDDTKDADATNNHGEGKADEEAPPEATIYNKFVIAVDAHCKSEEEFDKFMVIALPHAKKAMSDAEYAKATSYVNQTRETFTKDKK